MRAPEGAGCTNFKNAKLFLKNGPRKDLRKGARNDKSNAEKASARTLSLGELKRGFSYNSLWCVHVLAYFGDDPFPDICDLDLRPKNLGNIARSKRTIFSYTSLLRVYFFGEFRGGPFSRHLRPGFATKNLENLARSRQTRFLLQLPVV